MFAFLTESHSSSSLKSVHLLPRVTSNVCPEVRAPCVLSQALPLSRELDECLQSVPDQSTYGSYGGMRAVARNSWMDLVVTRETTAGRAAGAEASPKQAKCILMISMPATGPEPHKDIVPSHVQLVLRNGLLAVGSRPTRAIFVFCPVMSISSLEPSPTVALMNV